MGLYYIRILGLWDSMALSENEDLTTIYGHFLIVDMIFPVVLVNMFEKNIHIRKYWLAPHDD